MDHFPVSREGFNIAEREVAHFKFLAPLNQEARFRYQLAAFAVQN